MTKKSFAWLIAVLLIFSAPYVLRGMVSDKEIALRERKARLLVTRAWKTGQTNGKIVDGQLVESDLPQVNAKFVSYQLAHKYSDFFQTYTVFEFEGTNSNLKHTVWISRDSFYVIRNGK